MSATRTSAGLPQGPLSLMYKMYRHILPGVRRELGFWREKAQSIPDEELRTQAIASMSTKEFHCIGGAVYAAGPREQRPTLLRLITAFQTISDYLDNLCDRSTSLSAEDFRSLHQSMLDAVDPSRPHHDYYEHREQSGDNGYLRSLVDACRDAVSKLPAYPIVKPYVLDLVGLYSDLQVYKHIHPSRREQALLAWWRQHQERYPDLEWNEFAAACGSTLGVFMLFQAACEPRLTDEMAAAIHASYHPYLCALHILLDYLIDQEEDRTGGDLNFCSYYRDAEHLVDRLRFMAEQAAEASGRLPDRRFHLMIIEGLLALYLSDPKVSAQRSVQTIRRRLMVKSPWTRIFFWFNSLWIRSR